MSLILPEEAAYAMAEHVRDCVCRELDRLTELDMDPPHPGCPCWVDIWPGEPPHMLCCEDCDGQTGQLSVHIGQLYETQTFPGPDPAPHPCPPQIYVAQIGVTVLRCLPGIDERGDPPTPDEVSAVSKVTYADMRAVHTALACCLPDTHPVNGKRRRIIVQPSIAVPPTSCAGSQTTALIDLGAVCCPKETS